MFKSKLIGALALILTGCGGELIASDEVSNASEALFLSGTIGPPSFETLMTKHSSVDLNSDGNFEINALRPLSFEIPNPSYANAKKGMVIVFVESRVLGSGKTLSPELVNSLTVMRNDLVNEGYYPRFVEAALYSGPVHQDGQTMLALRRFLKDVYAWYPLRGTILVGSFPDTTIVRRVMLKNTGVSKSIGGTPVTNANTLSIVSEQIAVRADIVLSDLDGNWESIYQQGPTTFRDIELIPGILSTSPFPYSGQSFVSYQYNTWDATYSDFFFVRDESTSVTYNMLGDAFVSIASTIDRNPEISSSDATIQNPIARPEIEVTRINARHVATVPTLTVAALDGQGPLAVDGKPRDVPMNPDYGPWTSVYGVRNIQFERRLLVDYLARNHSFRTGADRLRPYRVGAIRARDSGLYAPADFSAMLKAADPLRFGTSVSRDNAGMDQLVSWLKTSMTIRGVAAHADWFGAEFAPTTNATSLDAAVGGRPWRWLGTSLSPTNYVMRPTLASLNVADSRLYRTLWENSVLASVGQSFWLHDGCSVNSVANGHQAYNSDYYGYDNHAESILFYANALEVMARAKVFNDTPRGFGTGVSSTQRFSSALSSYVKIDATDAALNPINTSSAEEKRTRTLDRKRTYFWSVLGDFTLQLRYEAPL